MNESQTVAPEKDIFGQPTKKEEIIPEGSNTVKKEEVKTDASDITKHPEFMKMQNSVSDMSTNLKNQNSIIERLSKENADLKGKKAEETVQLPYDPKTIKRSKDLTEDERDEMTKKEIQFMDERADAMEAANKAVLEASKTKTETKEPEADPNEPKAILASEIEALSAGDAERKREIIEASKFVSFEGLKTKEEIAARLKIAAEKFIPNYTPPKEQATASGKAVAQTGGLNAFAENDKIIKEAQGQSRGNYSL